MTASPELLPESHHEFPIDVRWGEMDALGHVNNVVYLSYFEAARVEWLASIGHKTGSTVSGPVVLQTTCTYKVPVVYPCQVKVVTRLQKVGNSSFTLSQNIYNRGSGERLYTESVTICVWVDRASGKSLRVPDVIRRALSS